ncbi:MAG: carbohydrate ABC transporter substrate-binding protein [Oscillospiraceae bacterium]|nr:carbohydrate ABC transporter substrate-binding protein [Oscillospiraceae bacterium]
MKKYIALLLCVLMIATCFVGCGKKEEKVDLVVWTAYAEGTPAYEVAVEKIAEFEELKGVNLEVQHYGTDLGTILGTALDSGERVDVFPLGSTIQLKAQFEHTMDITKYVTESDVLDRAYPIHMEIIKQQSENNDQYHAIPTVSSFSSFWYNAAAFEKAGITENPETIEEFEEVCRALVAAGYNPIALDAAYATSTFGALVERMVGETIVGDMTINGGFSENEDFIAACQKIIDWKAEGFFDPNSPSEWPASQNKIGLTEENVMVYTGMWLPGEVEEMTGASLEWGCFKFPYDPASENGTYGASVSCTCNCINVNCENPDLAWEYIYYMCTGEVNKAITDADVYLVDDMTMEPLPRFDDAKVIMETTDTIVNYAGGLHNNADIKTSINDTVVNLFSGTYATGEEAAAAFDALLG